MCVIAISPCHVQRYQSRTRSAKYDGFRELRPPLPPSSTRLLAVVPRRRRENRVPFNSEGPRGDGSARRSLVICHSLRCSFSKPSCRYARPGAADDGASSDESARETGFLAVRAFCKHESGCGAHEIEWPPCDSPSLRTACVTRNIFRCSSVSSRGGRNNKIKRRRCARLSR